MTSTAPPSREPRNGLRPQRTVVLVGAKARRACEQPLRRHADVALARAATACDALGELFRPIAEDAGPPLVVVGNDALTADEASAFSRAARSIHPRCHLRWLSDAENEPPPPGFESTLPAGAAATLLQSPPAEAASRDAAEQPTSTATPSRGAPDVKDAAAAESPPQAPQGSGAADLPLVHAPLDASPITATLQGDSPLPACLDLLRHALGDEVRFLPAPTHPQHAPSLQAVPVERHGQRFGWLVVPQDVDAARAGQAADWLAAHLALDAQARALRQAAFTDELTGAWNRRYFHRFLESAIERARRQRTPVTLLVFDIDDFKSYNDRFGHAAGDTILTQTVKLLQSDIRPSDRVCRIGGDEFAVIFDDPQGPREPGSAPPSTVAQIAERFQRRICEHRFPELAELAPGTLTISGGLATFPWDAHDPDSLLRTADELALRSKKQGKNHLTFGPGAEQVCRLLPQEPAPSPPPRDVDPSSS